MSRQFLEVLTVGQFISTVIQGKSVTCLEDLGSFFVKELKNSFVSRGIVGLVLQTLDGLNITIIFQQVLFKSTMEI